ncbi:MAG: hypothetical protein M3Q69_17165 [Acidobacteriota bacterium]|nr:hypothetical protein [Acidobacteriota bacterium]
MNLIVPRFDLYAPRELSADFPLSMTFAAFVAVHLSAFVTLSIAVAYLQVRRANLPKA